MNWKKRHLLDKSFLSITNAFMLNMYIHQKSREKLNLYYFESRCFNDLKNSYLFLKYFRCISYSSLKHFVTLFKYSVKMNNYLKYFSSVYKTYLWISFWISLICHFPSDKSLMDYIELCDHVFNYAYKFLVTYLRQT